MKSVARAFHAHACAALIRRADFEATDALVRILGSSTGLVAAGPADLLAVLLFELGATAWRHALARARSEHSASALAVSGRQKCRSAPV